MPENSGFTPIIVVVGTMGSVRLRSTARPPDSTNRTVISASSGRDVLGTFSSATVNLALPFSSVCGRSSSVTCSLLISSSSSLTPNHPQVHVGKISAPYETVLAQRKRRLRQQIALFGSGTWGPQFAGTGGHETYAVLRAPT